MVWSATPLDDIMPQVPQDQAAHEMQETVRGWLETFPLAVEELPPANGMLWWLRATGDAGEYAVGIQDSEPDQVAISALLAVPPEVSSRVPESVLTDIRIGLLAFDVNYFGLDRPLRRLTFSTGMFWLEANREQFVRALHRVRNAMVFVNACINRAAPSEQPDAN